MRYAIALILLVAGCATVQTKPHLGNANRITAEELAQLPAGNLYDVLTTARPSLLNDRGYKMAVFVDGLAQFDGLSVLKMISSLDVASVERVSSTASRVDGGFSDGPALYIKRKR
jgi:hypothetical protein